MLDEGVGYNQYNMFLPHARYKHTGVPLSDNTFIFFGGCAGYDARKHTAQVVLISNI